MELNESMFNVEAKIERNKLKCKIIFTQDLTDHFEYAFYLLKNKERIDTQYYTMNSITEFELHYDGEYSVIGFVKYEDKKVIKTSEILTFKYNYAYGIQDNINKRTIPISIFGSCVSRDILEFDNNKILSLRTYIARQSIISAISKPLDYNIEDIDLKSHFQKRMILNDFDKKTFDVFKRDGSEYLIIDLIDERFDIINYKDTVLTLSNELKSTDFYEKHKNEIKSEKIYKIKNWKICKLKKNIFGYSFMLKNELLDNSMKKFCDEIKKIYKDKNIIIHKAYMVNYFIDKNGQIKKFPRNYIVYNQKINERLHYMYDYLENNIKKSFVIDGCNNCYADESHKWGLAPMHYETKYYEYVLEQIKKYCTII